MRGLTVIASQSVVLAVFIEYFNGVVNSDLWVVGAVGRQLVKYIFSMKSLLIPVLNRHKLHTTVLLRYAPDNVRYLPPYNEALQRLKGEKASLVTRGVNKLVYGQQLLVS